MREAPTYFALTSECHLEKPRIKVRLFANFVKCNYLTLTLACEAVETTRNNVNNNVV